MRQTEKEPRRVALLWDNSAMVGQRIQAGVYRLAEQGNDVVLRRFDVRDRQLQTNLLQPLQEWRPHGIVAYSGDVDRFRKIRQALPGVPIVATARLPETLAETVVGSDWSEILRMCHQRFVASGAKTMALFCCGNRTAAQAARELFEEIVPGAPLFYQRIDFEVIAVSPRGKWLQKVGSWLKNLPKPIGIYTQEVHASGYLSRVCQRLKLNIPQTVQLIGPDDIDGCLACSPPLTSIVLPAEAIGETAMKILLRHMNGERPRPERLVLVSGASLTERGSTCALPAAEQLVTHALNLVRSQAIRGLTAKELVRQSEVSTRTLYKKFHEATGDTPARMLRQLRLEEACRLLRETSHSIEQIVARCGFGSASYFAQSFRRELGMSPSEYRREHVPS